MNMINQISQGVFDILLPPPLPPPPPSGPSHPRSPERDRAYTRDPLVKLAPEEHDVYVPPDPYTPSWGAGFRVLERFLIGEGAPSAGGFQGRRDCFDVYIRALCNALI